MKRWFLAHSTDLLLLIVGLGITVSLRAFLLDFKSPDYFDYTKVWYGALKANGFSAFGTPFSNYNLPYLYLLYAVIRFFPDIPAVIAIKMPSLVADYLAAFFVFRILKLKFKSPFIPLLSAFSALIAPTIVLNSSFWGQADAVYCSMLLACIYFVCRRRDHAAMIFFGIALALKVQSLFLGPLVVALVLRREIRWRTLIWIPIIFVSLLLPAWIAGRSLAELLWIYPSQALQYQQLSMHAPSALAWIPDTGRFFGLFNAAALVGAAAAALGFTWLVFRARSNIDSGLLIELAMLSAALLPFCLPLMHERYFYLADLLSIPLAFMVPSLFYVPIMMIGVSFFAYQPALFGVEPVSMSLLAVAVLVMLVTLCAHALPQLLATPRQTESAAWQ